MNKIYYGNGNCSIKGEDDIIALQIHFEGAIHIEDKTPPQFHIVAKNNIILIFLFGITGELSNLFNYKGEFRITSILAVNRNNKKVLCRPEKVMDYFELLKSTPESLDIEVEKLNVGDTYLAYVGKTKVDKSVLEDQFSDGIFYYNDGEPYHGPYHVHWHSGKVMTGSSHTGSSKILYEKNFFSTKNLSIKTGRNR